MTAQLTAPTPSDAGRALLALRRRVTITCTICGETFVALPTARTCSGACRSKLYYQRTRRPRRQAKP